MLNCVGHGSGLSHGTHCLLHEPRAEQVAIGIECLHVKAMVAAWPELHYSIHCLLHEREWLHFVAVVTAVANSHGTLPLGA